MNAIVILCDTLRRDHCGPYHHGKPLNQVGGRDQPDWVVPTPNLDRLAAMGTVFDQCYTGSTPCMPARRDLYTGCYEFLRRGWGPLEDDDLDLPGQVSPHPTKSLQQYGEGEHVSYLVTDHLCLWTNGAGNYHMNYSGFDFIRGNQEDPWTTAPVEFEAPEADKRGKLERYFRNKHFFGGAEQDSCVARVFGRASEWLERNHQHQDFFLHIDSYDPHEPWDPPEELVKMFDPQGYDVEGWTSHPPYAPWRGRMNEAQFNSYRARYAAKVVLMDRWLGKLLDTLDALDLWENTLVIFMTDHGTYNGDHGRIGKGQSHEHSGKSHTPFIVYHPEYGHGERRSQLVQNVDVYSTVLDALGKPSPERRDGVSLIPVLQDQNATTRDYAIMGQFGHSISITDGEWTLHQPPDPDKPLYWYSYHLSRFYRDMELGPFSAGRRQVLKVSPPGAREMFTPWLTNRTRDPGELGNLESKFLQKVREMQRALKHKLDECKAPHELLDHFQIVEIT
jgi:arylsulfatase A-like enzyme